jgi:hypothetical protein
VNNNNSKINNIEQNEFLKRAPKVWGVIATSLSPEELEPISEIFNKIVIEGLLESPAISREEGVSFNPRPARIVEILLKEGLERDPGPDLSTPIKASLLVNLIESQPGAAYHIVPYHIVSETSGTSVSGSHLEGKQQFSSIASIQSPTIWISRFKSEMEIAKNLLAFEAAAPTVTDIKLESFPLGIGMSRALDCMRHAHMSDPQLFNKDKNIHIATTLLELSKKSGRYARLATLLETATIRFKNRR